VSYCLATLGGQHGAQPAGLNQRVDELHTFFLDRATVMHMNELPVSRRWLCAAEDAAVELEDDLEWFLWHRSIG